MVLFDTHAHYDDEAFEADRDDVLAALPGQNVGWVIDPGCTLASSRTAIALAEKFLHVYAAVGIHPENCQDFVPAHIDALRQLARQPKVVAIGEVGLDYYWKENPPRDFQKDVLYRQMALAGELDLPVIFHDREAHADSMEAVRAHSGVRGVFHCYSGSVEDAATLLSLGWMVSFNGAITFKNARKAPQVIAAVPLEKMMIETDSPYLTPVPHRGERNDSSFVHLVAEKIAEIKGVSPEEVERVTTENAKRFFRIP
jgi:TatD DNase family protein